MTNETRVTALCRAHADTCRVGDHAMRNVLRSRIADALKPESVTPSTPSKDGGVPNVCDESPVTQTVENGDAE